MSNKNNYGVYDILNVDIKNFHDYNETNKTLIEHYFQRKINDREWLLEHTGDNAYTNGDGRQIANDKRMSPNELNNSIGDYYNYDKYDQIYPKNLTARSNIDNDNGSKASSTELFTAIDKNFWEYKPNGGDYEYKIDENYSWNKNSIIYKTRKLWEKKKIKTIVSEFHTDPNIKYDGQIRTMYGESHGNNVLKYGADPENGATREYPVNGYNNPYCRVWTHHHKYSKFSQGLRSGDDNKNINYWTGFDWTEEELKKYFNEDLIKNKDDKNTEKYPYAWRGKHNQDRRTTHSALDIETGLVKIAPKMSANLHPKDCMFAIENLAWRDYDPYSFENGLSWEQRGPLGGRIMWFPPYGISITESTSANWHPTDIIGRGEKIYTYVNTERTGNLTFYLITDHPSSVDYSSWYPNADKINTHNDYMRYFAGCNTGKPYDVNPNGGNRDVIDSNDISDSRTMNNDMLIKKPTYLENEENEVIDKNVIEPKVRPQPKTREITFFVFFPNNYSGIHDLPYNDKSEVDSILYLILGNGAQRRGNENGLGTIDKPLRTTGEGLDTKILNGYEMISNGISEYISSGNYIVGSSSNREYTPDLDNLVWYYRFDCIQDSKDKSKFLVDNRNNDNYITQKLIKNNNVNNYVDNKSNKLNLIVGDEHVKLNGGKSEDLYSFAEIFVVMSDKLGYNNDITRYVLSLLDEVHGEDTVNEKNDMLFDLIDNYELVDIATCGMSNRHGHSEMNNVLSQNRGKTIKKWLQSFKKWSNIKTSDTSISNIEITNENPNDINCLSAKLGRATKVTLKFKEIIEGEEEGKYEGFKEIDKPKDGNPKWKYYELKTTKGYFENGELKTIKYKTKTDCDDNIWVDTGDGKLIQHCFVTELGKNNIGYTNSRTRELNKLRYDQEAIFFQRYLQEHPLVYEKIQDKLKYFNPVLHSMTPEGFNSRLTFLHQCTRQGNTITKSDGSFSKTATNLAFGRPPYCVLRLGDFYNQLIVIDNISFDYTVSGGITWDLNLEGNGVQPMLCQVNISFKFIGGGDITGPVRRLQNAMTFNYYANTSFYDNRADRIVYNPYRPETVANGQKFEDFDNSYTYTASDYVSDMDKKIKNNSIDKSK